MVAAATHKTPGFRVTKTDAHTIFHRVPIFAECSRGDSTFDADWIAGAVAAAKQQERDGYLPPLHTRHHEPETAVTDAVRAAGVFRVLEAGPLTMRGKRVTAIFADLIVTDLHIAGEIERMRYPYRSVEIFDVEGAPEINGLALLDHEAPYLTLPMLFAGEVEDRRTGTEGVAPATSFSLNYSRNGGDSVLGFARRGRKAVLLFRFSDDDTMSKTDTEKAKLAAEAAARANLADDGGKDDDKDGEDMEGEDKGLDVAAVVKAIESGEISVADMDAILAAIQAQGSAAPEEDAEEAAPAPTPGAEIMKGKAAVNFARLEGEVQALRAKEAARDARDKRAADVKVAMKRLEGRPLGADLETRLLNFHEKCGGNAEVFKEYVETMARTVGDLPDGGDAGARFSGQPKTPKEAMAFQALGGEAVDKAAAFCREYDQLKKSGMKASREAYVRVNMKRLGYEPEEAAA